MDLQRLIPARIRDRRFLSWALCIIGLALLVYVATQYGRMYAEQRRLSQEWEKQNSAQPALSQIAISTDEQLTRLMIPKINMDAVVVEGTSRKQLAVAPGHLKESPLPGEEGNVVITAHRDTFFRHIYDLQKGDVILVRRNGKVYNYEVTGKRIVEPDDLTVVRPSKDARLTLITCYPTYYLGPAPERLVIFSKLVAFQNTTRALTTSAHSGVN